jgi:hypothetical protein
MTSHVIFAGMLDDPYIGYAWVLLTFSIIASVLCFYRYKLGYGIIPITEIVSAGLLRHFLDPENYGTITGLSHLMPKLIVATISAVVLPILTTYFGWRRFRRGGAVFK